MFYTLSPKIVNLIKFAIDCKYQIHIDKNIQIKKQIQIGLTNKPTVQINTRSQSWDPTK